MNLPKLNFPEVNFRFQKNEKGKLQVFDSIRKKFIDLTPEEWVRQHVVHFLISHKNVPQSKIAIEKQLILNKTKRRTDIVIYNELLKPILIVECKAPNIKINQETINQALRYNIELNVAVILLTNGYNHIFLKIKNGEIIILNDIPNYNAMHALNN